MLTLTPQILAIAPGGSGTISAQTFGVSGSNAITAVSNNTAVATVTGSGNTPGPVTFTVTAGANAVSGCLITFSVAGDTADSGQAVPICIIPQNTNVATGLTATKAIAKVRRRTNLQFGQPPDSDITEMLNDGIRMTAKNFEPIITQTFLPIVSAQQNVLALPFDLERVRDANFATTNPSLSGANVYEMVQLDYDEFIQMTNSSPVGGIGGIPAIYTIIQDSSGVQLIQFYPYANVGGQLNLHYYKRPTLWTSTGSSTTDLDELWEEAVITYACQQVEENRENESGVKMYRTMHKEEIEENKLEAKRRLRKRGTNTVRDVSEGESIFPAWMR